ncbi:hypothetical protein PMAC_000222 [Pneumocystis sp. 'macacae']|nr:hypothetical protein PMAC_000222 [Pneumocystis sp. 'macacae']
MATLDLIRSKFATLNSGSQEEITSVSSWVLFHRRSAKQIVETWMQSLRDASGMRKLNLIYLANDVTQQSKARKREEFVNAFSTVIAEAMENAYLHGTQDVQNRLKHVANVWEQRNIFSENVMMDVNKRLERIVKKSLSGGKIGGVLKSSLVPELSKLNLLYHNLTASISSSSLSIGSSFSFYAQLMETDVPPVSPLYASKFFQLLESLKLSYSTSKAAIVVREDIIKQLEMLLKENNSMLVKENEQLNEIQKKMDHVDNMKQKIEKMVTDMLETSEDENFKPPTVPEKEFSSEDQTMLYEQPITYDITNDETKSNFEISNLESMSILHYLKNIENNSTPKDTSEVSLIENIEQRLLLFLAQNIGSWSMIYKLYTRPKKHLYMVSLSFCPGVIFCKTQQISVEVDGDFEQMITKTKLWNMRQTFQLKGDVYEVNDFIVRIASTDKGLVINIEYATCDTADQGQIIIQNFLTECLIPTFKNDCIRLSYNEVTSDDLKSSLTSGFQFIDVLKLE